MESEFFQEYQRCVLDGLKNTLGESGMNAVLCNIESHRLAEDARTLHKNLHAIFGEGVFIIEKVIVKELHRRLNVPYEEPEDFDFVKSVNRAGEIFKTKRQNLPKIELATASGRKQDCKRTALRKP
jgi:hypothetical protein